MSPVRERAPAAAAPWFIIAAGVSAALHVGKLAPAVPTLQAAMGLSIVEAGFLLSLVQGAGMALGLAMGSWSDGIGARRSMLMGLLLQAVASAAGALAPGVALLMATRLLEGLGFLLVVLPAPGLLRRLTPPGRVRALLGSWAAFMPLALALALLAGPLVIGAAGWRGWWLVLAAVSAGMAAVLRMAVPPEPPAPASPAGHPGWRARIALILRAPGPWLVALTFAVYSAQWLAVIGFLPTIYAQAGLAPGLTGVLTAAVAAANIVGNTASGRLMQRGAGAPALLAVAFVAMAVGAWLAFSSAAPGTSGAQDSLGAGASAAVRYAAVLLFSAVGGLIPGTLFSLAVQVAPDERAVSATVGWMQQWSATGQFLGPPAVAWVATQAGGWQATWLATGACCVAGLGLSAALARLPALSRYCAGPPPGR